MNNESREEGMAMSDWTDIPVRKPTDAELAAMRRSDAASQESRPGRGNVRKGHRGGKGEPAEQAAARIAVDLPPKVVAQIKDGAFLAPALRRLATRGELDADLVCMVDAALGGLD